MIKKGKYIFFNDNRKISSKIFKGFVIIINNFSFFIFIIIYITYFFSLEKCLAGHGRCSKNTSWIKKKLNEGIICSFFLLFICEMMILNIISKLHLIHIIIMFISFFIYSHGLEFFDHGLFNILGVISILIIGIIMLLPLNILLYIVKKNNKLILYIYIFVLINFLFSYNYYLNNFLGCKDWVKGLNNSYIKNDINKYDCQIKSPKYCPYKFMSYFMDLTKRMKVKCGISSDTKKRLLKFSNSKYLNDKTKKIGFPVINEYIALNNKSLINKTISNIVSENLLDLENKQILKNIQNKSLPEIIVDFSDNENGKMIVNLHFNKNLSLQRKEKEKEYHPYTNNIIILYFDSVSRANGMRHLKKTLNFFERFMPYKSEKFHSFQFFKYHAFKHYTPGNYPRLFFTDPTKTKKEMRITYYLKKYGFVTAFSNDMCFNHPFPTNLEEISKEELCDHEFILCDPNQKHVSSMTKRCLYEKTNIEYQYEYGLQFWRQYKHNRKFLMIVNNDGHEGTLEVIKYDDDIIFNFLNTLFHDNLLNDTTILLLSDHGNPMPSIYYFNDFFQLEKFFPMLYIMTSDKNNQTYYQQYNNIHENQHKFITALDIYNTICYLMLGNDYYINEGIKEDFISKKYKGINLFDKINITRSPKNYSKMNRYVCI